MMRSLFRLTIGTVAIAGLVCGTPAAAADYLFTYTVNGANVSAQGSLTTSDDADAQGFVMVTALTGSRTNNGTVQALTLLPAGAMVGASTSDRFLNPAGTAGLFGNSFFKGPFDSTNGLGVTAGGRNYLLADGAFAGNVEISGGQGSSITFTLTRQSISPSPGGGVAGAVPEPASWTMLIVGMGLTGGALRRKRVGKLVPAT